MKNVWKALAGVTAAAALVITPLVTAGAMAEETPPSETALVADTAPTIPSALNSCTPGEGVLSTDRNDLWANWDTRSKGHVEYVTGGLHIWTDDATSESKVSEIVSREFALSSTGVLGIDAAANPGNVYPYGPGLNLRVDFDNNNTVDGTLVYEGVYGQDLWLTGTSQQFVKDAAPSHTGGNGSDNHGTIDQWLTAFPNAKVKTVAYALGSGVHGDWTISSITVNCSQYTFDTAPTTPVSTVIGTCSAEVAYPTSTNLAAQGWSFKPDHAGASYVDGGLSLDATINGGAGSSWAIKTLPAGTHLSEIGDLTTTFVSKSGPYWGGVILEGGDLTAQLHFDDNGRFWTTQAGIFAADRAGYYQSFPIDKNGADVPTSTPALQSDPIIGTLKIYVNSGQKIVVGKQSYLCGTQAFTHATAPVATDPGTTDPGTTDPGTTTPGTTDPAAAATSTGSLASTGGPDMAPWWIGAAALMLAGAALITLRRVVRK